MSELTQEIIDNAPEGAERYNKFLRCPYLKKNEKGVFFAGSRSKSWKKYEHQLIGERYFSESNPLPSKKVDLSKPKKHSHYFKDVSGLDFIDVYKVCELFGINDTSGAMQHAIKKLLCSGQRGVKDERKDIQEAVDTLNRKLEMMGEGK